MILRPVRQSAWLAAVLLFVPLSGAGAACPDLSGTFDCPADGGMPAATLVVSSKVAVTGNTEYRFTYRIGGKDMSLVSEASEKGVRKSDGQTGTCRGDAYVHHAAKEVGDGTRSFINASGNFERTSGRKKMVCVRKH